MLRALLACLFVAAGILSGHAYEYPFKDPYAATVFGTLPQDELPLASVRPAAISDLNPLHDLGAVRSREMLLHDRPVPEILWYDDTLQYTAALQPRTAPLLFLIAGTGSSHESATCAYLLRVFFRAGFHVVTLSSPTYPNFVVSASTTQVPGYIPQDVADLYQCMDAIANEIGRARISSFNLAGYSLGGTQSAFLAELDTREKRFDFKRVLLLNPSVSLRLQHPLDGCCPTTWPTAQGPPYRADIVSELSEAYRASDQFNFGDEFLFALYPPQDFREGLKIHIG
jgi:hypothetical protein